jgi:hypothetical protein
VIHNRPLQPVALAGQIGAYDSTSVEAAPPKRSSLTAVSSSESKVVVTNTSNSGIAASCLSARGGVNAASFKMPRNLT